MTSVSIDVTAEDAAACAPSVTTNVVVLTGYDDVAAVESTDDVESAHTPWTATGGAATEIWSRQPIATLTTA